MNKEIYKKVISVLVDRLSITEAEITPESKFSDLGADSLDAVDTIMEIEKVFNIAIPDEHMEKLLTVQDIVNYVQEHTR